MDYMCFQEMPLPLPFDDRDVQPLDASNSGARIYLHGSLLRPQQQQNHEMNFHYFSTPQFTYPAASWSTTDPTLLLAQSQERPRQEVQKRGSVPTTTKPKTALSSVEAHDDSTSSNPDSASISADAEPYVDSCGFSPMPSFDFGVGIAGQFTQGSGLVDVETDNIFNVPLDTLGGFYNCSEVAAASERIPNNADLYGLGAVSGLNMDPSGSSLAPLPWSQQSCSLLASDQFCSDGLMPPLVSDYYSQSSELQPQPTYCNNSSASVECSGGAMHEADSCGNSDRDESTTTAASDEITWAHSAINSNSDQAMGPVSVQTPPIRNSNIIERAAAGAGRSTTTTMLSSGSRSSVGRDLTDEYSSTIVTPIGGNAVGFASSPRTTHITATRSSLPQHHRSGSGENTGRMASMPSVNNKFSGVNASRPAPVERVSWMAPVSTPTTTSHQLEVKKCHNSTLDQLLGSSSAGAGHLRNGGSSIDGLRHFSPSLSPYQYNRQLQPRACYTLDSIPPSANVNSRPLSTTGTPSQILRTNSGYPMAPLMEPSRVGEGGLGSNLYREFLNGFTRAPLGGPGQALAPKPNIAVVQENSARAFVYRRDFGAGSSDHLQPRLASPSRKQPATSIEPQSVAARHRRKKISERVRLLEKLIPGGSKMDTASMFDEAIEYVKFLQLQVQLLEGMGEGSAMEVDPQLAPQPGGGGSPLGAAEASTSSGLTSAGSSSSASRHLVNSTYCAGNSVNSRGGGSVGGIGTPAYSAALLQQSMLKTAAATVPSNSPLILSEVLQDQLFKQKLCLVSLQQYHICPQQPQPQQQQQQAGLSTRQGGR